MKFYLKDIPEPYPIWSWIKEHTDIVKLSETMVPTVDGTNLMNLNHQFDIDHLAGVTLNLLDKYGFKGWQNSLGESKDYGGVSLTMNPEYKEKCDPNQQTLGTVRNLPKEFFYSQLHNFESIKNTYYDSYAFRVPSPCVKETSFNDFLQGFRCSAIRGRIAVINSKYISDESRKEYGWHRDEKVFENLRINIPIKTDETFMFEILDKPAEHLKYGNVYSWDTHIPHRVFPTTTEDRSRVHIVLGLSPWFDYDHEEQSFTSNEFYGEMHPLDMLVNGHVHPLINGLKVGGG